MEPRVQGFAEQAVAELPLGEPLDIMPPYALRIPASVIGDLMGLDPSLHARLKRWADLITGGVTTVRPEELERKELARAAVADLRRYFGELLERRQREPVEDLTSDLLLTTAEVEIAGVKVPSSFLPGRGARAAGGAAGPLRAARPGERHLARP